MRFTTEALIRQIRAKIQEKNTGSWSDDNIIDVINQGQDEAVNINAKYYNAPIVRGVLASLNSDKTITILEDAFEQRLLKIEVIDGDDYSEVDIIDYRDATALRGDNSAVRPRFATITEDKITLFPQGAVSNYSYKLWYLVDVAPLVKSQGRISAVDVENNYIVVDAIGENIDVNDPYDRFINIIDSQTGKIKNTLQVSSTSGTRINIKTSPDRDQVINRNIDTTLSTEVEVDDYICLIEGTCILPFPKPFANFIIQFATAEIRRSLGYDVTVEDKALSRYEKKVRSNWEGRESTRRKKRRNPIWFRRR